MWLIFWKPSESLHSDPLHKSAMVSGMVEPRTGGNVCLSKEVNIDFNNVSPKITFELSRSFSLKWTRTWLQKGYMDQNWCPVSTHWACDLCHDLMICGLLAARMSAKPLVTQITLEGPYIGVKALFVQQHVQTNKNITAPQYWPFVRRLISDWWPIIDWWVPITKDQKFKKRLHILMSSWICTVCFNMFFWSCCKLTPFYANLNFVTHLECRCHAHTVEQNTIKRRAELEWAHFLESALWVTLYSLFKAFDNKFL